MPKDYYTTFDDGNGINLPSNQPAPPQRRVFKTRRAKWGFILLVIILIYLFYNQMIYYILELFKLNPALFEFYLFIESEVIGNTLKGLFFMALFGTLFFLVLPSEALFLYYISSTLYNPVLIISLMLIGNMIGMTFNYLFGRVLGQRFLMFIFRKNFMKYQDLIQRFGGYFLLFGNIIPGPIEVLGVFYGGFRFPFMSYLYLTLIGRLIKYVIIFMVFFFFWDSLVGYYEAVLENIVFIGDLYL